MPLFVKGSPVRYINIKYWLSIYWHFWKISISTRRFWKISLLILTSTRTFWKILISIKYRLDKNLAYRTGLVKGAYMSILGIMPVASKLEFASNWLYYITKTFVSYFMIIFGEKKFFYTNQKIPNFACIRRDDAFHKRDILRLMKMVVEWTSRF